MFIKQINDCLIENAIKGYGGKNVYFSIFREPPLNLLTTEAKPLENIQPP